MDYDNCFIDAKNIAEIGENGSHKISQDVCCLNPDERGKEIPFT